MSRPLIAHIVRDLAESSGVQTSLVFGSLVVAGMLSLRHLAVKHGAITRVVLVRWLAIAATITLASLAGLPRTTAAQDPQVSPGLPDLISDRPFIWFDKVVENADQSLSRVLAFDGYLHNVGEGTLDLFGNPQIVGDVKQRVFDGESWEVVGAPTVRYETSDGHNHFHLIGAVDYSLWTESRAGKVGDSSKVGFCLVDTEQVEETHDQFYGLERFDYCNEDDPAATELRMGITPGWRDAYDASITLQWVDVSDVQPGRYWVGAVTDPLDEILESDEDNNALVYSMNTFPVSGYFPPIVAPVEVMGETVVELPATPTSAVGLPSWTITTAPRHGSIDVPRGALFNEGRVVYRPDPGFIGTDSFRYRVRDSSRIYPLNPQVRTVELSVVSPGDDDAPENQAPVVEERARTIDASEFVRVEAEFRAGDPDGDQVRWFAKNLPAGLRLDEQTGVVSGVPTTRGFYPSQIIAWDGRAGSSIRVTWNIAEVPDGINLWPRNQLDLAVDDRAWIPLGYRNPGARYEAEGLPEGVRVINNQPRISGTPRVPGTYDILVRELVNGVETQKVEFTWTVRAAATITFPF